jgi:GH25 family lysozyme M1 (1,4-beta-N-acetylmuramidase)
MKSAGMVRGAFHLFEPGQDPVAQAQLFISALSNAGGLVSGDLPPSLDFEILGSSSDAEIQLNVQKWLDTVQTSLGVKPMIYTSLSGAVHLGRAFGGYPLWIGAYGVSCPKVPAGWSTWTIWQKSSTGTVPGISGAVDIDEFNGSLSQLADF